MTDEEIVENNKLIAKFMGGKQIDSGYFIPYWCIVNMNTIELGKGKISEYHKSWDWLMPVVEKIETLDATVIIDEDCTIEFGGEYLESTNSMHNCDFETFKTKGTKIEKVYDAVVEFINWYNEQ